MTRPGRSRVRALAVALAGALSSALLLAGCVGLPEDGSVRSVGTDDSGDSETLVDYTPGGPRPGSAPVPLVDSFLTAMTATPLNTSVARQFLTGDSSRSWVPEKGTWVYGSRRLVAGPRGTVVLELGDVVQLDARGTWLGAVGGRRHVVRLRLVQEGGEWRISQPPDRLLLPRAHFEAQYQQYQLYFFDKSAQVLVPEPVYVPRGLQAPTLLVNDLLQGPDPARADVERTFVPRGTALDGISVPVSSTATAEVPLSDEVLDLDDSDLNLLFAQLAWTLGQLPGVERMRVTVDGTPLDLPGGRAEVGVGQWSDLDPAVAWASGALFGLRGRRVVSLADGEEQRVTGPFGAADVDLRSIGVDLPARRIAGVPTAGTSVLESERADGSGGAGPDGVRTVYSGGTDVLRPVYDLYDQLWVVDRTAAGARLVVVRDGTPRPVSAPGVTGRDVRRFVLSRDGTRLVVQVRDRGRDRLQVLRVQRDAQGRVRGLTAPYDLPLTGLEDAQVRDIGWRTPGSLAVLVAPSPGTTRVLVASVDGSGRPEDVSTDAELLRDQAARLITSPAVGAPLYVSTVSGRLYSLAATGRWTGTSVEPGLAAATFVG